MQEFFVGGIRRDGSIDNVKVSATQEAAEKIWENRGETRVLELAVEVSGQVVETYAHLFHSVH